MIRTLTSEPSDYSYVADEGTGSPSDDYREFEFVLNLKHIVAVSFVGLVAFALVAGGAYFVGRTSPTTVSAHTGPNASIAVAASSARPQTAVTPPGTSKAVVAEPAPIASPAPAPKPPAAPLFQTPVPKALYIQLGAVEKGVATIMAEGLRDHQLPAFVSAGRSANIYRVLIGPLEQPGAYDQAKRQVDELGLTAFAQRF